MIYMKKQIKVYDKMCVKLLSANLTLCSVRAKGTFLIIKVKPVFNRHSKRRPKLVFKTDYRLMQVKSIAECSKGSILQYFQTSLSYHLPLSPFLSIFEWPLKTGSTYCIKKASVHTRAGLV